MSGTEIRQALLGGLVTVALRPAGALGESVLAAYEKLPLSALSALGDTEKQLLRAARGGETIYQICFQDGSLEQLARKTARRALTHELAKIIPAAELALQPGIFAVAAALLTVGRQVETMRQTQDAIRAFLRQQNEGRLQRDLETLANTPEELKNRRTDEAFREDRLRQVREIRAEAQRNLVLCRLRIGDALDPPRRLTTEQAMRRRMEEARSEFHFYQLSLYLFAFSTYLEVTMPERCGAAELRRARERVERETERYERFFQESRSRIEALGQTTVRSKAVRRLARAKRLAGETAARIPVVGASQVDENLISTGQRLTELDTERGQALLRSFRLYEESGTRVFAEQLAKLEALCGEAGEILLDGENLYFKIVSEQ